MDALLQQREALRAQRAALALERSALQRSERRAQLAQADGWAGK